MILEIERTRDRRFARSLA